MPYGSVHSAPAYRQGREAGGPEQGGRELRHDVYGEGVDVGAGAPGVHVDPGRQSERRGAFAGPGGREAGDGGLRRVPSGYQEPPSEDATTEPPGSETVMIMVASAARVPATARTETVMKRGGPAGRARCPAIRRRAMFSPAVERHAMTASVVSSGLAAASKAPPHPFPSKGAGRPLPARSALFVPLPGAWVGEPSPG